MQFITSGDRIATENFTLGRIYTVTFNNGNYFINTCIGIGPDYVMFQQTAPKMLFRLDMETAANVDTIDESGGGSGTTNYNELDNKPQINGVILQGNKTLGDLSIYPVPIVTSEDNNKILTASYVGGSGSYSWQPAPSSGTTNYNDLNNKPQINSIELSGNKSLSDLGIQSVISDLDTIRSGAAAGATAVQPGTLSGYQTLIDSSHKLSSDLVDDDGHDNKFATAAQLAQIETNKNNILTFAIATYSKTQFAVSAANTYEYTGVSFTVPANQVFEFIVCDQYNGGGDSFNPSICVADSSTNIDANATIIAENTQVNSFGKSYWCFQLSGITPRRPNDTTYYIWVKHGNNTINDICLMLRRVQ